MAKKRLKKLRRTVLGRTTAGRLTRAAGLAGLIGGGGFLASRSSSPGSSKSSSGSSSPARRVTPELIAPTIDIRARSAARIAARDAAAAAAAPAARPSSWKGKGGGTRRKTPAQPSRRRAVLAPVQPRAASKIRLTKRYERLQSMADGDVPGVSQAGRVRADKMATRADRRARQYGKGKLPNWGWRISRKERMFPKLGPPPRRKKGRT